MVAVTGMGAVSALGTGLAAHRAALFEGRHGFRPITRFDASPLGVKLAATWPGWDGRVQADGERDFFVTTLACPVHEIALLAAREALAEAKPAAPRARIALVFGSCFGQGCKEFSEVAERVAAGLEIGGPRITISTACCSSTNAIARGEARFVLVVAASPAASVALLLTGGDP